MGSRGNTLFNMAVAHLVCALNVMLVSVTPISRVRTIYEATLTGALPNYFSGYGCWCNFEGPHKAGGYPVDEYDSLCMKRIRATKCTALDVDADCDHQTSYNLVNNINFTLNPSDTEILNYCHIANNGQQCEYRHCALDYIFIRDFWNQQQLQNSEFADTFLHATSGMPECALGHQQTSVERKCCGTFPERFVFATEVSAYRVLLRCQRRLTFSDLRILTRNSL